MKGLIVYSGGLDSTVLLHQYANEINLAVSFNYGSNHNEREIEFAHLNCEKLGIEHLVLDLDFFKHFKSALLGGEIPKGHYEDETMKSTVVPFRNGIMLSIAAGLAESRGLDTVLIANHFGDHAIYPDCRFDFIKPFAAAIHFGTYNNVEILSPYCNRTKKEIAQLGKEIGVDFSQTYSCYEGRELHCGECGTCVERKEALQGFDNTKYYV